MADKEINVKFVTDVDLSNLEELSDVVNELKEDNNIELGVDVDSSSVDDAKDKTRELNEDLDETDSKTVSPEVDSSGIDDLKSKTDEASSSMDNLVTAAAGIGVTAGVEQMVTTADRINTSWNQLELTFGSVSEDMKSDISSAADVTGRSGGTIRSYFNQMGIAGVTNTDLLSSSFEALSGRAYQTGNSVEEMEGKMQRMVLTGNVSTRMLSSLGLSAESLATSMGVSADQVNDAFQNMTPEERLNAITKAMGDGKQANEMYKNSYQGLKTQAETAMAGLMGAVGQAILPVVIPALKGAAEFVKGLTDAFKSLPGPVQGVIGGVLGFAGIVVTAIGVLGTLGTVFTTVKTGLEALNIVSGLAKVATYAQAAAQWALNIAMDANPIGILIIAITALVAILGYLYFNNEQVRAAIDGLGQTLMWVGQIIYDSLVYAFEIVISTLQNFWNYIVNLGANLTGQVGLTNNTIINAIVGFLAWWFTLPAQIAVTFVNIIAQALGFGNNFVQNMTNAAANMVNGFIGKIQQLPGMIQAEFSRIASIVSNFVLDLPNRVWDLGASIVSALKSALGIGSPGYMYYMFEGELKRLKNAPLDFSSGINDNVQKLGAGIVDSFDPELNGVSVNGNAGGAGGAVVGGGDFIVNIYGDVDSDKRAKQIIDVIKNELNWNNVTAGRSV